MGDAPQEDDFDKLPVDDRLCHKNWKARQSGYHELTKLFTARDADALHQYSPKLGKFVADINAVAQEAGFGAVEAFIQADPKATARHADEITSGIVAKGFGSMKPSVKAKCNSLCKELVAVDAGKEVLQVLCDEGLKAKQPKVVLGSASALKEIVQVFGPKQTGDVKQLVAAVPTILDHKDGKVRAEGNSLLLAMHLYMGDQVLQLVSEKLKEVQVKELEKAMASQKDEAGKKKPERLTLAAERKKAAAEAKRAAAEAQAAAAAAVEEGADPATGGSDATMRTPSKSTPGAGAQDEEEDDISDLAEPKSLKTLLTKEFFEAMKEKKWSIRRDALEEFSNACDYPKLEIGGGDMHELLGILKDSLGDSNVLIVAAAARTIARLSKGLRREFHPFVSHFLDALMAKFKEKKTVVVTAIRDALDAIYQYTGTDLKQMADTLTSFLGHKNPDVKRESTLYVTRCLSSKVTKSVPKELAKDLVSCLRKAVDDPMPATREVGYEGIGVLMQRCGQSVVDPLISDLDDKKKKKIAEYKDKHSSLASLNVTAGHIHYPSPGHKEAKGHYSMNEMSSKPPKKGAAGAKGRPRPAAAKPGSAGGSKRPGTAVAEAKAASAGPAQEAASLGGASVAAAASRVADAVDSPLPQSVLDQVIEESLKISQEKIDGEFKSKAWKERLAAMEWLENAVKANYTLERVADGAEPAANAMQNEQAQAVVSFLVNTCGMEKEANFQVLGKQIELVSAMADGAYTFSMRTGLMIIPLLADKLADIKQRERATTCLKNLAERVSLNFTVLQVLQRSEAAKNPKIPEQCLTFVSQALADFGCRVEPKAVLAALRNALKSTNEKVRLAAINVAGVLRMFLGPMVRQFLVDEKPALLQLIDAEFERVKDLPKPETSRTERVTMASASGAKGGKGTKKGAAPVAAAPASLDDLVEKKDLPKLLGTQVIREISDSNWKVRNEALEQVTKAIQTAQRITSNLQDLTVPLKGRLQDSNKNLCIATLNIYGMLATAMGKPIEKHIKTLEFADVLSCLSDNKTLVRNAAINTVEKWSEVVPLNHLISHGGFATALAVDNPHQRSMILDWLTAKGETETVDYGPLVKPMLSCLEDRSVEVRKKTQGLIPAVLASVDYQMVIRAADDFKPAAKKSLITTLDKYRPASAAVDSGSKSSPTNDRTTGGAKGGATAAAAGARVNRKGSNRESPAGTKDTSADDQGNNSEQDIRPLLMKNHGKDRRLEKDRRFLKLIHDLPRDDLEDHVRDQALSKDVMNHDLVNQQLFNATNFKQQIAGLSALVNFTLENMDDRDNGAQAMMDCADVIFKYAVLRFLDNNNQILFKVVELLNAYIPALSANGYRLAEGEAQWLLPSLINKVGDKQENVRKDVRSYFRLLCGMYPASKIFATLASTGLDHKNARVRSECLEEMQAMMQRQGLDVCQPSPGRTAKLCGSFIGDRDIGVRNAALNCCVQLYTVLGEVVWKHLNDLNTKDRGLLEERIKRSASDPQAHQVQAEPAAVAAIKARSMGDLGRGSPSSRADAALRRASSRKEFDLELDALQMPSLSSQGMAAVGGVTAGAAVGTTSAAAASSLGSTGDVTGFDEADAQRLDVIIAQIGNADIGTSVRALKYFEDRLSLLESVDMHDPNPSGQMVVLQQETVAVHARVEKIVTTATLQLKTCFEDMLGNENLQSNLVIKLAKHLLNLVMLIATNSLLARALSMDCLESLLHTLLHLLLDEKLKSADDGPNMVRAINTLTMRILDNCNRNNSFRALLSLLYTACGKDLESPDSRTTSSVSKYTELVQKCIWKQTKALPTTISKLRVSEIFYDLHRFLETYPPSMWKEQADDRPLRTVKTIIYEIARVLGSSCLDHLSLIPVEKREGSRIVAYLNASLRSVMADTGAALPADAIGVGAVGHSATTAASGGRERSESPRRSHTPRSKTAQSRIADTRSQRSPNKLLSQIFTKIGTRERSQEGLAELYDFTQQYPNEDLEPFLVNASEVFKNYIQRGLRNEAERRSVSGTAAGQAAPGTPMASGSVAPGAGAPDANSTPSVARHLTYTAANPQISPTNSGTGAVSLTAASPHPGQQQEQGESYREKLKALQSKMQTMRSQSQNNTGVIEPLPAAASETGVPPPAAPTATPGKVDVKDQVAALRDRLNKIKQGQAGQ